MSRPVTDAIGGWLREADGDLRRDHRLLEQIAPSELSATHLAYFEDYRQRYFNDRLIPGQGVEEIQSMLLQHGGSPRNWADLGAGVTTLYWSIGVSPTGSICACDLVPEALHVLAGFKESAELPPCYGETLGLLGKTPADIEAVRRLSWSYHVMDCLAPWTIPGREAGFDLVTAVGCFGLAADAGAYRVAFQAACDALAPAGRLAGADWIRSARFIDMEGHDNRYLSASLASHCAREAGLTPLRVQEVTISDDPYYDAVIVWAFGSSG
ncbi:MAG: hypothetical protein IOC82_09500 [Aestuariivirga sp.]|uniref:hypothetical protein n=1 Tax=Aestuariivirga sp. TaxID=2650926 RepID=UPI0025BFF6B3|nr:hypothetical protein [Aestuariivirga sp.]MCA3561245.1 hypothetical protein [Aestuariivirga sp.]